MSIKTDALINDSSYYEGKIKENYVGTKILTQFKYPLTATSIIIPALPGLPERTIIFTDLYNNDKILIYKVIIASYNYVFLDEFSPLSGKSKLSAVAATFVDWLNNINVVNRYNILKEYESYRFDKLNNHGGESALRKLRTIFFYAIERSNELRLALEPKQLQYLLALKNTKISPNLNKTQISLASYFGLLDWLRRDDVGIGGQLYQVLASPKLTVNSLKLAVSTILTEFYKHKFALKQFLKVNSFTQNDFVLTGLKKEAKYDRRVFTGRVMYSLLSTYHVTSNDNEVLRNALVLVLLSNASNKENFLKILPALDSQEAMDDIFLSKKRRFKATLSNDFLSRYFSVGGNTNLFDLNTLQKLCISESHLPSTKIETLMFSWLLSSLTVQPSDIKKLTVDSFRYMKVGNRVTHIECEYFKGRANSIHNTRSLSTRKPEGKALYQYLGQHSDKELATYESITPVISNGFSSISGAILEVLNLDFINETLVAAHKKNSQIPLVFTAALKAVIKNGIHPTNVACPHRKTPLEVRKKLSAESNTSSPTSLFGFQSIKNSAVHAYSDPYTLNFLVNYNSHSNKTEKSDYLNEDNEEWMNAAGRITRNVMLDLINNVFNLDFSGMGEKEVLNEKTKFNSEFSGMTEYISDKRAELISRLKIVTKQQKGKINEIGVLSLLDRDKKNNFERIYVLDSPVTVLKIKNYIYEFEANYKKLLCSNPDFLYKTAMPTVEWMVHVLKIISKDSVKKGDEMFKKMKKNNVSITVFHSL